MSLLKTSLHSVSLIKAALLLLVSILLAHSLQACGWHLRGSMAVDIEVPPIYLEFQNASTVLRRELTQTIESTKAPLVTDVSEAELILVIHAENRGRRVLSVDLGGNVSEYELQYELVYSVRDNAGEVLIANERTTQQRNYRFDDTEVLASGEEERKLFDFMRRTAIQAVMRRLISVVTQRAEVVQPEATNPSSNAD